MSHEVKKTLENGEYAPSGHGVCEDKPWLVLRQIGLSQITPILWFSSFIPLCTESRVILLFLGFELVHYES